METSSEWTAACQVQQRFMQHQGPNFNTPNYSLDYSARCRQLHELGGDFYDFVPLPGYLTTDNRLALAVGDASGKGLAAALMISNVQSSLRTATLLTGNNPAAALAAVNQQVHGASLEDRYATLFYGVFDRTTHTLRYVNAGHPPPVILRKDGSILWLERGGAPVGIFPDWIYEEGAVQLRPGDRLLAYTDGVIEAASPGGEEWGIQGLLRAEADSDAISADDMVHAIFTSMDEFSRGRQTDDATVLALRVD